MRTIVVTPPQPVVSWEDADKHLKLGGDTSQRDEVEAMIAAAAAHIDGPDGWLGRALSEQTLEARFDWFDPCGFALPLPPLVSVTSVKYLDAENVEQTLAVDQYEAIGNKLVPAVGASWPSTLRRLEAVRIRYVAGYAELPKPIRTAILMMVGDLYRFRETAMQTQGMPVPMSIPVKALLSPYQVFR